MQKTDDPSDEERKVQPIHEHSELVPGSNKADVMTVAMNTVGDSLTDDVPPSSEPAPQVTEQKTSMINSTALSSSPLSHYDDDGEVSKLSTDWMSFSDDAGCEENEQKSQNRVTSSTENNEVAVDLGQGQRVERSQSIEVCDTVPDRASSTSQLSVSHAPQTLASKTSDDPFAWVMRNAPRTWMPNSNQQASFIQKTKMLAASRPAAPTLDDLPKVSPVVVPVMDSPDNSDEDEALSSTEQTDECCHDDVEEESCEPCHIPTNTQYQEAEERLLQ